VLVRRHQERAHLDLVGWPQFMGRPDDPQLAVDEPAEHQPFRSFERPHHRADQGVRGVSDLCLHQPRWSGLSLNGP
jgi:hypothetical protein